MTIHAPSHRGSEPGVCTGVVGLQWGDEGKGKIVDMLAAEHDVVVRYNGGANAGHSVVIAGQRYALHLIPAGILSPGKLAVIGNGVVVDPEALLKELDTLTGKGVDVSGLVISERAHVVMPYHKDEDALREDLLKSGEQDHPPRGDAGGLTEGKARIAAPFTIRQLSAVTGVKGADIVKKFFLEGIVTTVNAEIDPAKARSIMQDFDIDLVVTASVAGQELASAAGVITEIGTTRRGIGPSYADKVQRAAGVRMADLVRPDILASKVRIACALKDPMFVSRGRPAINADAIVAQALAHGKRLAPMIRDTTYLLHDQLAAGKRVLFEGANGTLLDVDHGTYPYVTGSNTGSGGIGPGTGVPTQRVRTLIGVMKAYSTRVGSGPMPTELFDAVGEGIRQRGREFGTTTGRPRRVGWLDLVALKYASMVNGVTGLSVMLLDVLAGVDELRVGVAYTIDGARVERFPADGFTLARATPVYSSMPGWSEPISGVRRLSDLPAAARRYLDLIEQTVGVPVAYVSVGPDREQTIRV